MRLRKQLWTHDDNHRLMGNHESQEDYCRLMRLRETTGDSWDSYSLLGTLETQWLLGTLETQWEHRKIVSQSLTSPPNYLWFSLVSWVHSSFFESHESPLVSLSLMRSSWVYESHESTVDFVSSVPSSIHESHESLWVYDSNESHESTEVLLTHESLLVFITIQSLMSTK